MAFDDRDGRSAEEYDPGVVELRRGRHRRGRRGHVAQAAEPIVTPDELESVVDLSQVDDEPLLPDPPEQISYFGAVVESQGSAPPSEPRGPASAWASSPPASTPRTEP